MPSVFPQHVAYVYTVNIPFSLELAINLNNKTSGVYYYMFVDVHNLELLRLYITVYILELLSWCFVVFNKSGAKASWRLAASLRSVTPFNIW